MNIRFLTLTGHGLVDYLAALELLTMPFALRLGAKTGTVSHAQTLKGWFVMARDSKDSHPGNKLWGDGCGWSSFDAEQSDQDDVDRLQG